MRRTLGASAEGLDTSSAGLSVSREAVGAAASGLKIEQAERLTADYIVIGSHGHTAFYDLLVGSTASGVLKSASCPVVIVPHGAKRSSYSETFVGASAETVGV